MIGLLKSAAGKIAKSRIAKGIGKGVKKAGKARLQKYKDRFEDKKEFVDDYAVDIGLKRYKKKKNPHQKLPPRQMRA